MAALGSRQLSNLYGHFAIWNHGFDFLAGRTEWPQGYNKRNHQRNSAADVFLAVEPRQLYGAG